MYKYDHSLLSLADLHTKGVRKTTELEEVIEGESFATEQYLEELGYKVIRFIGFTKSSKALKIACRLLEENDNVTFITLDARIPSVNEIKKDFCKYCR